VSGIAAASKKMVTSHYGEAAMRRWWKGIAVLICVILCEPAGARGLGGFVARMVARGALSATVRGAPPSTAKKVYTPDVLTVDQLVACLRRASVLDREAGQLEAAKSRLDLAGQDMDREKRELELQGGFVDRRSQAQIDRYNSDVEDYNARSNALRAQEASFNGLAEGHNRGADLFNVECAKNYYRDDMDEARRLAGL
jgi:hypothetical protein